MRASNNLIHWIKFFLVAVYETAEKGKATFQAIMKLRSESEGKILGLGKKAPNARKLLNDLYSDPIVGINDVAQLLNVTHQTASALIRDLQDLKILYEQTGYQRNKEYIFASYLSLFLD